MNAGGVLLLIFGLWAGTQLLRGDILQRLGLIPS